MVPLTLDTGSLCGVAVLRCWGVNYRQGNVSYVPFGRTDFLDEGEELGAHVRLDEATLHRRYIHRCTEDEG